MGEVPLQDVLAHYPVQCQRKAGYFMPLFVRLEHNDLKGAQLRNIRPWVRALPFVHRLCATTDHSENSQTCEQCSSRFISNCERYSSRFQNNHFPEL